MLKALGTLPFVVLNADESGAGRPRGAVSRLGVRTAGSPTAQRGCSSSRPGSLVLSPDSLLIRLMTADDGTLLLLRGAFSLVGYVVPCRSSPGELVRRETWRLTRPELAVGCLMAVANVLFVTSILRANAALALVIIASAPAFTSMFSRRVRRRGVAARTWIASWSCWPVWRRFSPPSRRGAS